MLKKLRLKFVLVNMVIVTSMLIVILGMVYHFTKSDLDNQSANALQTITQRLQQPGRRDVENWDIQLPWFMIQISFWGEVTAGGNTRLDLKDEALVQELIQTVLGSRDPTGAIEKYDLLYGKASGAGMQYLVFVDTSVQKAAVRSQVQISIIIGLVSLAAFGGISILLARWAIKPVERAWQQQKQFVSDASHELKTPLTVILSNAELLQSPDCDEDSRLRFSESILTMSRHMRRLVEGLLELARAENGQVQKSFAKLYYSKLVEDALLPFEPVMYERGLLLESSIEPDIILRGSEQHLQQLADILLDNAAKYAEPGIVAVKLQRQGRNQCLMTVSNPGKPIPAEDLEKIFERFYRRDLARSRTGSFGLGLAIARTIAQEHGGKIWAESNETGTRFCVLLPCDPK